MRNSEKQFADYLTEKGFGYIYHPCRFKLSRKNYTPDFYVQSTDTYYEVILTNYSYNYHKDDFIEMRTMYPNITLKVVMPDGSDYSKEKAEINIAGYKKTNYPVSLNTEIIKKIKLHALNNDISMGSIVIGSIKKYAHKYNGHPIIQHNVKKKMVGLHVEQKLKDILKSTAQKLSNNVGRKVHYSEIITFCAIKYLKSKNIL